MKLKRLTSFIGLTIAATFSVFVIAGCGGSQNQPQSTSSSTEKTYTVATRGTFRPVTYVDDKGNLTGFDVEVLKEIDRRDPTIKFNFKPMAIDAAFVAMDANQVDIIANQMRHTKARDEKYIYNKGVINYTVRKLVVKNDRSDINSLDDLQGKKIAVTTNGDLKKIVEDYNKTASTPIETIFTDKGSVETLNLVLTGRADAAGEYVYTSQSAIDNQKYPLKIVGPTLRVFSTHWILKKDDEHQQLADKLDKDLEELRKDGTLKKLSEQYLGADYSIKPADAN